MSNIPELFGSRVFNESVMRATLSEDIYQALRKTIEEGRKLDPSVADAVASAMCSWAISKGATHYTHWFQPLSGITAEKHDGLINLIPGGGVLMKFSGKELIKGEPDASSFPSGGLRTTFEARGYTAWDPSSYAFIKENTLCIPTAFCSYDGNALDKKTPLLRSMEALNRQALRLLRLFGNTTTKRVAPCVGAEQEYFLVDRAMYLKRKDLVFTGRTLFGAKPSKGQEMEDHYFGAIKPRVQAFMQELDKELWELGIPAKTEHNEVAPGQHELAPIFTTASVATDQNQLMMEIMKKVARRHSLACLLHEKPFAWVNGSGKHNNWSLSTDDGVNLLSPGETPSRNAQFLLFLVAIIKAVDDYQSLLRLSVATASNDHRLGGHEAPPSVISIFLGDELTDLLDAVEKDTPYSEINKKQMKLGTDVIPPFPQDATDRNRTSPFAFTGNKFEFRMVGSGDSIASANITLNAAVAATLHSFADDLEKASDFNARLHTLIKETITAHKRIIFNGNGYDEAWVKEAVEKRGLLNLPTTPDALPYLLEKKNMDMFISQKIFSESELRSRSLILFENYIRIVRIEALTMIEMAHKEILPAVSKFTGSLSASVAAKRSVDQALPCRYETKTVKRLSALTDSIDEYTDELEGRITELDKIDNLEVQSRFIRDRIVPQMNQLRHAVDEAETLTSSDCWPFPTYGDLLFGV